MLGWIAQARAALVPPARRPGAVLVDLGCGGGLLAPHLVGKGYRHIGVDLTASALVKAVAHGVGAVRGDACRVPLADECADVVSAGELLEHVPDPRRVLAEACRLLRPGGLLVLDTINATRVAKLVVVTIGEHVPGLAPRGIHDPALFVPPWLVVDECAKHGITMTVRGLRPKSGPIVRFVFSGRGPVPLVPSRSAAMLYQAIGTKADRRRGW